MKRLVAAVAAASCLLASPALAARWNVDYAKSKLGFAVQWSGQPFGANFGKWNAVIDFDPNDLAHAHVVATIDLASEASDSPDNDDGIKGAAGFQVAQFPTARFEATGFTRTGANQYAARGLLTIKGAKKPVTLNFRLQIDGDKAHASGTADVMRLDWGLGEGAEWSTDTPVSRKVGIFVEVNATRVH
jgi:polyisoprenoid-binding protein YceI